MQKSASKDKKKPYLTIIIPCYNEAKNLQRGVLGEIREYLQKKKFAWEVIISDDGSTDNSVKLVEKSVNKWSGFYHLKNPHGGKPSALWYGIQKAKGEYVLFTDMDQSTPIGELDRLLPHLEKGYKTVIGSRGLTRKNFAWYRRLGSIVFMSIRKSMVLSEINDTQCGFKLFNSKEVKKAFPLLEFFRKKQRSVGWKVTSYDVELLHILKKMGSVIKEVRVTWEEKDESDSKGGGVAKYLRESKEMLMQILRVKINDMRGMYDI